MYLYENSSTATKSVAGRVRTCGTKTKPSPQEFVDAYTHGLRQGRFTGRVVLTFDYVDGQMRRYRIQEPAKTIHAN